MLARRYKLASNFNTVEFEITPEEFITVLQEDEVGFLASGEAVWDVPDEELIKRVLQREYDILASIQGTDVAPAPKPKRPPTEPASPKQIEWARNLGMKDPEKKSKSEVWGYIQKHR